MTPQVAQLIGGAGTGKTTELLRIMEKTLEAGVPDPFSVGFCSFTRAARREASSRAADKFGIDKPEALEREGWFRTLHSCTYRCLGVKSGELLSDNKESRDWLKEALQEEVSGPASDENGESIDNSFDSATAADMALQIWGAARNRLLPLEDVWHPLHQCDDRVPSYAECVRIVKQYEQRKYVDDRIDFVDMLGQFAGWKFSPEGHERCEPQGWIPEVPCWLLDECQDNSALTDAVARRLTSESKWVYLVGDPYQALYGFGGGDSKYFMSWPIKEGKKRIMPKSYRCPAEILAMGEAFLRQCSDYWDRGIAPADHHGQVQQAQLTDAIVGKVDPSQSWLLIARTNFQAKRMAAMLDRHNIPWAPTKGSGGWDAPVRNTALRALYDLEQGAPIDGEQWRQILKYLPSRIDGVELLERGTKKRFEDPLLNAAETHPFVMLNTLDEIGGTTELRELIHTRRWRSVVDHGTAFTYAAERWGVDVAIKPKVLVGTIHSVKGSEATNVILNLGISLPVVRSRARQAGKDEEQRVFYVGATRARERLILATDRRAMHNMKVPA